jgi:hypothetical protein
MAEHLRPTEAVVEVAVALQVEWVTMMAAQVETVADFQEQTQQVADREIIREALRATVFQIVTMIYRATREQTEQPELMEQPEEQETPACILMDFITREAVRPVQTAQADKAAKAVAVAVVKTAPCAMKVPAPEAVEAEAVVKAVKAVRAVKAEVHHFASTPLVTEPTD